mmetsp:Transcript_8581/g.25297  ORF Transcript_8581/g.25297 Transcript_8581/m.25297 type:complete len:360 (-) Transcript_8581:1743-2822(-)
MVKRAATTRALPIRSEVQNPRSCRLTQAPRLPHPSDATPSSVPGVQEDAARGCAVRCSCDVESYGVQGCERGCAPWMPSPGHDRSSALQQRQAPKWSIHPHPPVVWACQLHGLRIIPTVRCPRGCLPGAALTHCRRRVPHVPCCREAHVRNTLPRGRDWPCKEIFPEKEVIISPRAPSVRRIVHRQGAHGREQQASFPHVSTEVALRRDARHATGSSQPRSRLAERRVEVGRNLLAPLHKPPEKLAHRPGQQPGLSPSRGRVCVRPEEGLRGSRLIPTHQELGIRVTPPKATDIRPGKAQAPKAQGKEHGHGRAQVLPGGRVVARPHRAVLLRARKECSRQDKWTSRVLRRISQPGGVG